MTKLEYMNDERVVKYMKHLIRFIVFCVMVVNILFIAINHEALIEVTLNFINTGEFVIQEEEQSLNDTMASQVEDMIEGQTSDQMTEQEVNTLVVGLIEELKRESQTSQSELDAKLSQIESTLENLEPQMKLALYNQLKQELSTELTDEMSTMDLKSFEEKVVSLADQHLSSVVGVSNEKREVGNKYNTVGTGSGVIFYKNLNTYYVMTNEHVIHGNDRVSVYIEGIGTIVATVVGYDSTIDLALLRFTSSSNLTVSSFTASNQLKQGQIVFAMGNPFGYDLYQSVTMGIISGLNRKITVPYSDQTGSYTWSNGVIQHDAPISPGNSGGPLFDLNGYVIGINNAINSEDLASNIGFAIPSSTVIEFINRYMT
jgi:serine protease Do